MLKKSGAVLLAMLYVVTVLGFALNLCYGDNQTSAIKTNAPVVNCSMNKATGKMQCCKDNQDADQAGETSVLSRFFGFELPHLPFGNQSYTPQPSSIEKYFDGAPADNPAQNIAKFIKNCLFRL